MAWLITITNFYRSITMANPKNSPFFDDILEAEELAEEEAKAKVIEEMTCDCMDLVQAIGIKDIEIACCDTKLYIRGVYNAKTVVNNKILLSFSFETIQRIRNERELNKTNNTEE